ncbi:hypothetical protein E2320_000095, partial [Naja naja]
MKRRVDSVTNTTEASERPSSSRGKGRGNNRDLVDQVPSPLPVKRLKKNETSTGQVCKKRLL